MQLTYLDSKGNYIMNGRIKINHGVHYSNKILQVGYSISLVLICTILISTSIVSGFSRIVIGTVECEGSEDSNAPLGVRCDLRYIGSRYQQEAYFINKAIQSSDDSYWEVQNRDKEISWDPVRYYDCSGARPPDILGGIHISSPDWFVICTDTSFIDLTGFNGPQIYKPMMDGEAYPKGSGSNLTDPVFFYNHLQEGCGWPLVVPEWYYAQSTKNEFSQQQMDILEWDHTKILNFNNLSILRNSTEDRLFHSRVPFSNFILSFSNSIDWLGSQIPYIGSPWSALTFRFTPSMETRTFFTPEYIKNTRSEAYYTSFALAWGLAIQRDIIDPQSTGDEIGLPIMFELQGNNLFPTLNTYEGLRNWASSNASYENPVKLWDRSSMYVEIHRESGNFWTEDHSFATNGMYITVSGVLSDYEGNNTYTPQVGLSGNLTIKIEQYHNEVWQEIQYNRSTTIFNITSVQYHLNYVQLVPGVEALLYNITSPIVSQMCSVFIPRQIIHDTFGHDDIRFSVHYETNIDQCVLLVYRADIMEMHGVV